MTAMTHKFSCLQLPHTHTHTVAFLEPCFPAQSQYALGRPSTTTLRLRLGLGLASQASISARGMMNDG